MRLVLVVLLFTINLSALIAKRAHFYENLKEESEGRDARFFRHPIFERRLPQSPFIFQGGDLFDKGKFTQFLSLLNDNSKGNKREGRYKCQFITMKFRDL